MDAHDDPMPAPLRVMVYDQTDVGPWYRPGLSHSWWAGGWLYRGLSRLDAWKGFRTWPDAFDWLLHISRDRPLREVQYWGHGKWGSLMMDGAALRADALEPDSGHPLAPRLEALRPRMSGPDALWWFRTCETFGGADGHHFAQAWSAHFDCRVAGHTFIIGPWQSGLHTLRPGQSPDWSATEGIIEGDARRPRKAAWSTAKAPNTISCLHGSIPADF